MKKLLRILPGMMRRAIAALLVVSALAACHSPTAPPIDLTGHWSGSTFVPDGSGGTFTLALDLSLVESNRTLTGTGTLTASGVTPFAVTVTQGTHLKGGFSMTLAMTGFQDIAYSGDVNGTRGSELSGYLNGSGFAQQPIVVHRQ